MSRVVDVVRSAERKLRKSCDEHGWGKTLLRCLWFPCQALYSYLVELKPRRLRQRLADKRFDQLLGVDTRTENRAGWLAQIGSPNWRHGLGYEPIPEMAARDVLRRLPIRHEDFTFIDFGSGKGRMLLVASQFPFRRVIGVEYAPALHEIAQRNLAVARNDRRICANVSSVLSDAAEFELPLEPLIIYLHHPFFEPVVRRVVERIEQSLAAHPRPLWAVYHDPQHVLAFDECPHLARHCEGFSPAEGVKPIKFVMFKSHQAVASPDMHEVSVSGGVPCPSR